MIENGRNRQTCHWIYMYMTCVVIHINMHELLTNLCIHTCSPNRKWKEKEEEKKISFFIDSNGHSNVRLQSCVKWNRNYRIGARQKKKTTRENTINVKSMRFSCAFDDKLLFSAGISQSSILYAHMMMYDDIILLCSPMWHFEQHTDSHVIYYFMNSCSLVLALALSLFR